MQVKKTVIEGCEILNCGLSGVSSNILCLSLMLLWNLYYFFLGNAYSIIHYWQVILSRPLGSFSLVTFVRLQLCLAGVMLMVAIQLFILVVLWIGYGCIVRLSKDKWY